MQRGPAFGVLGIYVGTVVTQQPEGTNRSSFRR